MALVLAYLFFDFIPAAVILSPWILFYAKNRKKQVHEKQKAKFALAFRDGMQAVVTALQAGYSLENSFREALKELDILYGKSSGIYQGFAQIVHELNLNHSIEEAFHEFAGKYDIEEIHSFSQVLFYAKRSGGKMTDIIKNTTESIDEKLEVMLEIRGIMSAKKLEQQIMQMVPPGIILYLRFSGGGILEKLYGSPTGVLIMGSCLAVWFFCGILADRITNIQI